MQAEVRNFTRIAKGLVRLRSIIVGISCRTLLRTPMTSSTGLLSRAVRAQIRRLKEAFFNDLAFFDSPDVVRPIFFYRSAMSLMFIPQQSGRIPDLLSLPHVSGSFPERDVRASRHQQCNRPRLRGL